MQISNYPLVKILTKLLFSLIFISISGLVLILLCGVSFYITTGQFPTILLPDQEHRMLSIAARRNIHIPDDAQEVSIQSIADDTVIYIRFVVNNEKIDSFLNNLCFQTLKLLPSTSVNPFDTNDFCGVGCPDWWNPNETPRQSQIGVECYIDELNSQYKILIDNSENSIVYLYNYQPIR